MRLSSTAEYEVVHVHSPACPLALCLHTGFPQRWRRRIDGTSGGAASVVKVRRLLRDGRDREQHGE
jgi:hypothetical protein